MINTGSQPENHELSFTLDLTGLNQDDARELVETVSGYGVSDLAIYGIDMESLFGRDSFGYRHLLQLQIAFKESGTGKAKYLTAILRDIKGRVVKEDGGEVREDEIQALTRKLGVPVEAFCLVREHAELGRNYLVSSRNDVEELAKVKFRRGRAISDMYKGQSHHFITPNQIDDTLKRLQRRLGHYYIQPRHTIKPRGFYYREVMLEQIPAYQAMWSTAVFGIDEAKLERDLLPLADSLDHRATALLQVRDDLDEHAHEVADNGTRWEMLNQLQYFAMLATGLFDNLAWLTAIRYGFYREYMEDERKRNLAILKIRKDANGQLQPNRFHYRIQNASRKLYNVIVSAQDIMDILYPIRDSVQHRFILGTIIWHNSNEGWSRVMIHLPNECHDAIQRLEASYPGSFTSWGFYPSLTDEMRPPIEPSVFTEKAVLQLFSLVQAVLEILNFPDMVAGNSELLAKVLQPRKRD